MVRLRGEDKFRESIPCTEGGKELTELRRMMGPELKSMALGVSALSGPKLRQCASTLFLPLLLGYPHVILVGNLRSTVSMYFK